MLGVNDTRQVLGMFDNFGNIHEATDIRAAMADKNTRSDLFISYVSFRGEFSHTRKAVSGRGKEGSRSCGSTTGFYDCLRDILGFTEWTSYVNTRARTLQGIEQSGMAETIFI